MFLHLGENITIPIKKIIGIFDIESTSKASISREFLEIAQNEGNIYKIGHQASKNKSFILTKEKIYLSQISAMTLFKRANEKIE